MTNSTFLDHENRFNKIMGRFGENTCRLMTKNKIYRYVEISLYQKIKTSDLYIKRRPSADHLLLLAVERQGIRELRYRQSGRALLIQLQIKCFSVSLSSFSPQQELRPPSECSAAHDSILNGFIFNLLTQRLLLYSDLQIGTSC